MFLLAIVLFVIFTVISAAPGNCTMQCTNSKNATSAITMESECSRSHQVVVGDTLFGIAVRQGYTLDQVLKCNPNLKDNPDFIVPGQTIQLP